MKKEDLIALGLSEEQADAVVGKYVNMIPKSRLDQEIAKVEAANQQIAKHESDLETLKGQLSAGDTEIKAKFDALQAEQLQAKTDYENNLKNIAQDAELKLELVGNVHDVEYALSQLDRGSIQFNEDNKIVGGFKEQFEAFKAAKPFAVIEQKQEVTPQFNGWVPQQQAGADKPVNTDLGTMFAQQLNTATTPQATAKPSPWS